MSRGSRSASPSAAGVVEVRAAGVWRRAAAACIDLLPWLTIWGLVVSAMGVSAVEEPPPSQWNLLDRWVDQLNRDPGVWLMPLVVLVALGVLLPFAFEAVAGWSLGERILGLRVIDGRGRKPTPARALAHCLLRVPSLALLLVGALWAIVDPERRAAHDRLAGIWVVHVE